MCDSTTMRAQWSTYPPLRMAYGEAEPPGLTDQDAAGVASTWHPCSDARGAHGS
jgi:hypothetical protein